MQYENSRVRPGKEGIYRVRDGFALFYVDRKMDLFPWAIQRQYVDLRSKFFAEYAQKTSQMHKLEKVDAVPQGAVVIGLENAPVEIRGAYLAQGGTLLETPTVAADVADLPSIKLPEPDEEEPEPKKKPAPRKKTWKKKTWAKKAEAEAAEAADPDDEPEVEPKEED